MVVYDTTFKESFESAKNWIKDLRENANVPDIVIAVVGNKCDMTDKQEISVEDAHSMAKGIQAEIVREVSAKDNQGINELFMEIATKLYKKQKQKDVRILI